MAFGYQEGVAIGNTPICTRVNGQGRNWNCYKKFTLLMALH